MVKHMQQGPHALPVTTRLCRSHIIDDHVSDSHGAVLLLERVFGQCAGHDLREVLMLGDRQHLFLGELARAMQSSSIIMTSSDFRCDAVLEQRCPGRKT
jgi:hypothetical protein